MTSLAQAQGAPPGSLLDIRILHIVCGDGQTVDLRSVRCPAQEDRSIPLAECLACAESAGVATDRAGRTEHVSCRHVETREGSPTAPQGGGQTPISAIMTTDVVAVRPEVSLDVLTDLLLDWGIGGAPVVDPEGRPRGIVSKTDLLGERFASGDTEEAMGPRRHVSRGHYRIEAGPGFDPEALPHASVGDAMTHGAFTISENAPIAQAAALLSLHSVHGVPVTSDVGTVVGIVTSSDIVRWVARVSGYLVSLRHAAQKVEGRS